MRAHIRALLIFLGLCLVVTTLIVIRISLFLNRPAQETASLQEITVKQGVTLTEVAGELETRGIITGKRIFLLWARMNDYGRKVKAGEYELGAHMTPRRILEKLIRGEVKIYSVTIPEGLTRKEIAEVLAGRGLVKKERFLQLTGDPTLVEKYGFKAKNLEGYLYPDTYQFSRGLYPEKVIDVMVGRFLEMVDPLAEAVKGSGMSLEKVITLASIVEKETGKAEERSLIASVFLNRLKKRMRLESDPTVIYGLPRFDGNLTRKDLRHPTPYNTYLIPGLPPGPIANPGISAIRAVLFPEKTKYLYFVSKNNGSHHFSKTLAEHNRAVNLYQKKNRRNRQKTS